MKYRRNNLWNLEQLNGRLVFITEPMEDNDLPFALFLDEDVNDVAPGNQTALHLSALFHEYGPYDAANMSSRH